MKEEYEKIGIVLLNYDKSTLDTFECVNSLINSGCAQEQIYILDNNSEGKYKDLLKKSITGKVTISYNPVNSGFAKGCNIGIKYFFSRSDISYILLLNNDTIVPENFLKDLVIPFLHPNPIIGIVSPLIYHYCNKDQLWYGGVDYISLLGCYRHNTDRSKIPLHGYIDTDVATGCCMLFRKTLIEKVGFLDEDYFMYLEDVDFSLKVLRAGFRILLNVDAHIFHKVGTSSGEHSVDRTLYCFNSHKLLIQKNYSGVRRSFYMIMAYIANIHGGIKLILNRQFCESMVVFKVLMRSICK
ncbi:MAG: glycosyltransferase family 2 protein [Mobilitalea sp.]